MNKISYRDLKQQSIIVYPSFYRDAPCVVVNVEYRLAPEHRWPANHEDATCVVRWVKMNKSLLGKFFENEVLIFNATFI